MVRLFALPNLTNWVRRFQLSWASPLSIVQSKMPLLHLLKPLLKPYQRLHLLL